MASSAPAWDGERRWSGPGRSGGGNATARRLNRETAIVFFGWPAAVLMQFAHPLVAAGIAEHSSFAADLEVRVRRVQETVDAMLALTFGDPAEVRAAAAGINAIHDRVHGHLRAAAGPFPAGTRYSAHDPALLRWVHATLLDVAPRAYRRFVGPLSAAEQDRYCREAAGIAPLLGIPDGYLPASLPALRAYLAEMRASRAITVTPTARRLAHALLYPPLPTPAQALLAPSRLAAIGLLPPAIRAGYGFAWDERHALALACLARLVRAGLPLTPPALRYLTP